jgi:CheY-like chemotaxis protein
MSAADSLSPAVMIVDDDPGSIHLAEEAFREVRDDVVFHTVINGEHTIDYLARIAAAGHRLPDLVLLDLNMPTMNGYQVLAALKDHPRFRTIPVVIFTSSNLDADKLASLRGHAHAFLTKSMTFDALVEDMRTLSEAYLRRAPPP